MLHVCKREFVIECICYYLSLDDIPILSMLNRVQKDNIIAKRTSRTYECIFGHRT